MAVDVDAEVTALAHAVARLGRARADGSVAVPFGVLFRETADECEWGWVWWLERQNQCKWGSP